MVKRFLKSKNSPIFFVLIALIVFFALMSENFLTQSNMLNVLRQVSMLGITSVGFVLVMITGGVDLSVGSQITFVNILAATLMVKAGVDPVLAALISIAAAVIIGFINGIIIIKIGVIPLIVTLAMMNVLRGVSYLMCGGQPVFGFPEQFKELGQGYVGAIPIPVIIMAACFAFGWIFLRKSVPGRRFYAVGGNEEAATLSGINSSRIKLSAYVMCGFFSGLAGIILLSRINSGQPITGQGFEFDVLTAVVLGGVSMNGGEGDMFGAIIGVIIMGMLNNGLLMINMNEYVQVITKGLVLLLAVSLDSIRRKRRLKWATV